MLKNMMVSLVTLVLTLLFCGTARTQAHADRYGGGSTPATGIPQRAPMPTVAAPTHRWTGNHRFQRIRWLCLSCARVWKTTATNAYGGSATRTAGQGTTASNAYGGSAYHAAGSGTTTATNAYGGSATHYAGGGTVATNSYGQTAYRPPTAYYGYHPPTTVAYYGTSCYNCNSGSTAGAAAAGAIVGIAVGAAEPLPRLAPKARAPTMQVTPPARPTRALPTPMLQRTLMPRQGTLMLRQRTPMWRPRMLMPPLPMRTSLPAPPTSRIRWAQFMGAACWLHQSQRLGRWNLLLVR